MPELDIVNQFLLNTRREVRSENKTIDSLCLLHTRPGIRCADKLVLSVQAGETLYCTPRDNTGPYSHVEVGFPSEKIKELMEWAQDKKTPTKTVYGYVPVEVVCDVIEKHGGIMSVVIPYREFLAVYVKGAEE